ncbi:MAG: 4Fe-4S binding protein, partial [Candidatus Omnitrophica bacterium]|nr:4Fe-4S binding protein [Candidatus Omnitrophota bacterium]
RPIVHCRAQAEDKTCYATYDGILTCTAANSGATVQACKFGCLGFGDCAEACPFDALHMVNGLPVVDPDKCTGCGKCVAACPRDILSLEVKKHERLFYVACSSHDNTLRTRQVCGVGCIACGICVKLSKEGFFRIEDNLSTADHARQSDQEAVKAIQLKCPTKVIRAI